jgi:hypothetical protein
LQSSVDDESAWLVEGVVCMLPHGVSVVVEELRHVIESRTKFEIIGNLCRCTPRLRSEVGTRWEWTVDRKKSVSVLLYGEESVRRKSGA